MSLNSVLTSNIVRLVSNLEQRANNLSALLSGSMITSVRIGDATITQAKIGNLSITTAKINDGAITTAKIATISASSITAGTISADRIASDSITADKLNVSTLSAITANLGTVTAGSVMGISITSPTFRTSTGNDSVQITDSNKMLFYEGGSARNWIRDDLFYLFRGTGSGSSGIGFLTSSGGGGGVVGLSSDTLTFVYGSTSNPLILFQTTGGGSFDSIEVARVIGQDDNTDIYISCANFKINGSTKTAIVPTSKGYRSLYCLESPEVWFYDIIKTGENIDPLFLEVTQGEIKTVTNKNGDKMIFRRRKGMHNARFESKSKDQFIINEKRWQN